MTSSKNRIALASRFDRMSVGSTFTPNHETRALWRQGHTLDGNDSAAMVVIDWVQRCPAQVMVSHRYEQGIGWTPVDELLPTWERQLALIVSVDNRLDHNMRALAKAATGEKFTWMERCTLQVGGTINYPNDKGWALGDQITFEAAWDEVVRLAPHAKLSAGQDTAATTFSSRRVNGWESQRGVATYRSPDGSLIQGVYRHDDIYYRMEWRA